MEKVIEMEENLPHEVSELILKCFHRWNGVYPERTPLKKLECTCGEDAYLREGLGESQPEKKQTM